MGVQVPSWVGERVRYEGAQLCRVRCVGSKVCPVYRSVTERACGARVLRCVSVGVWVPGLSVGSGGGKTHGSPGVWVRGSWCGYLSLWVRGAAGRWVPGCVGKGACAFRCVGMRMPMCVSGQEGAQVWAYSLVDKRVYGVRMSRWIRRGVAVRMHGYVRGQAGVRVCG